MIDVGDNILNAKLAISASTIYHYTSMSVLPVFFKSKADIYCTNSKCLNDPTELYFGPLRFVDYLEVNHIFDKAHAQLLRVNIRETIQQDWFDAWVMSFSEAEDDLSQWRGYVSGKDGGYSIGFNRKKLVDALSRLTRLEGDNGNHPNKIPILTKCWYFVKDNADINDLYGYMLQRYRDDFDRYQLSPKVDGDIIRNVIATIFSMSMHIKHDAFRGEREARIIITVPGCNYSKMEVLGGKPRMPLGIPDIDVPLYSLIDKIYLSPHGNQDALLAQATWLKKSTGANFEIVQSQIPYDPSR